MADDRPEPPDTIRALEQTTLLEISKTLTSSLELQPDLILAQFRMIVKYTHATLFALEDLSLVPLAVRPHQFAKKGLSLHIPLGGPEALAALFYANEPIRIANIRETKKLAQVLQSLLNDQPEILLEGAQSWMWAPLVVNGQLIGGMLVGHSSPHYFNAHHADLALIVANQAAIAMSNAELLSRHRI